MPDLDAMKDLLLEIIRNEILRIRVLGWDGRAKECSILADHIHNLPELIRAPKVKYLRYYLDVSRRVYAMETSIPNAAYEKEWSELEKILEQWESETPNQGTGKV